MSLSVDFVDIKRKKKRKKTHRLVYRVAAQIKKNGSVFRVAAQLKIIFVSGCFAAH